MLRGTSHAELSSPLQVFQLDSDGNLQVRVLLLVLPSLPSRRLIKLVSLTLGLLLIVVLMAEVEWVCQLCSPAKMPPAVVLVAQAGAAKLLRLEIVGLYCHTFQQAWRFAPRKVVRGRGSMVRHKHQVRLVLDGQLKICEAFVQVEAAVLKLLLKPLLETQVDQVLLIILG